MFNFYLQASTVGVRVIVLQLSYMVCEIKCQNTQMVELTVMQPYSFTTTFLTKALYETMQANTDSFAAISPTCPLIPLTLSSSRMYSSSAVNAKAPTMSNSYFCLNPKSTVPALCPSMLPQLDRQTITPGKFILCWTRAGDKDITNQTVFDLPSLKLSRASLYVECVLPPFGVLRTPLQATYTFHNRSQDIQELMITTDPSDAFMFSGPKQAQMKLFPTDLYTISLIF